MSNLIKRMVDNLLNSNGKGFDNVVMNNLQKIYDFDSRIIRPNCLTSLFLLDVNKSPKYAFMKIREDQEGYANKTTRAKVLADAISLEKCFNDKKLKKAKNTTLDNFIFGISFNKDNFKGKYGNSLFEGALLHVNENIPNEHFAVQLLSAITEAKTNATKKSDIEELLAIEERCKPLVYYALKKSCPFKKQSDLQNKVMSYFKNNNQSVFTNGVDNDIYLYTSEGAAYDYFRFLGTANIINTKLADKALINTDYVDVNDKNSLVYIDYAGRQRYLINKNHPEADDDKYRITDIIKNYCNLIKDGKATQNTKYISKALSLINYIVVDMNDTKDEQKNFLQTALAFLILMNEENVDDPFDFIGIALANPISDILALSQTNQEELKDLIQKSYIVANHIYKVETGKDLTALQNESGVAKNNEIENAKKGNTAQKTPIYVETHVVGSSSTTLESNIKVDNKTTDSNNAVDNKTTGKPAGQASKKPDYVKHNIGYYSELTEELKKSLENDRKTFIKLENAKTMDKDEIQELVALRKKYVTPENIGKIVTELKAMNDDMSRSTVKRSMKNAINKNKKEWKLSSKSKKNLLLDEEQYKLNNERNKNYEGYYSFIKDFKRELTLSDFKQFKKDNPMHPLCLGILKYLSENSQEISKPDEEKLNVEKHDEEKA